MHFESSKNIESKSLELSKEELKRFVKLGYFQKCKNRDEHMTVHPCWLNDVKAGISAELSSSLGKWNQKLEGYLIGYEKPKLKSNIGAVNEDHRWIHIDITGTFYVYQPEIDHQLKGIVKKKGNAAAICSLFNVFSVTVFAADQYELDSWSVGDEIDFVIYSFVNRRKGPILRGRSLGSTHGNEGAEKVHKQDEKWQENSTLSVPSEENDQKSPKKKKRKRDRSVTEESSEVGSIFSSAYEDNEEKSPKKKKRKRDRSKSETETEDHSSEIKSKKVKLETYEEIEESVPKKDKKKKRNKESS